MFKLPALAALAFSLVLGASASAQTIAASEPQVRIVGSQNLNSGQRSAFKKFQSEGKYYGAFVVSSRGAWSYRTNLNSVAAAEVLAKLGCQKNGATCSIYAELTPKPAANRSSAFEGLSQQLAPDAVRWLKTKRAASQASAIAGSDYWGHFSVTRNQGVSKARSDARRECQRDLDRRVSDWLKADEIEALRAAGHLTCRVIESVRGR